MIDRLIQKIKETGTPIVVGLDPQLGFIPDSVKSAAFREYGETLEGAAEALLRFNMEIVDAVHDLIPAVKPQIAMYERYGLPGLQAFYRTVEYCRDRDLVVIGDVKRGDIGSTSAAYADAHLGSVAVGEQRFVPFGEDFATVNPYLGSDGVLPFVKVCKEEDRGIFVLVKTSNRTEGRYGYTEVGAVVGATYPEMGAVLRKLMPKAYILVPGYGAQGGTGRDLVPFFNADGLGAVVNSSRGILAAWTKETYASYGENGFGAAARAAVLDMKKDIEGALAEA